MSSDLLASCECVLTKLCRRQKSNFAPMPSPPVPKSNHEENESVTPAWGSSDIWSRTFSPLIVSNSTAAGLVLYARNVIGHSRFRRNSAKVLLLHLYNLLTLSHMFRTLDKQRCHVISKPQCRQLFLSFPLSTLPVPLSLLIATSPHLSLHLKKIDIVEKLRRTINYQPCKNMESTSLQSH